MERPIAVLTGVSLPYQATEMAAAPVRGYSREQVTDSLDKVDSIYQELSGGIPIVFYTIVKLRRN